MKCGLALILSILTASLATAQEKAESPKLTDSKLGSTNNVHAFGKSLLCGQPSAKDFAEAKKRGIKTVVTLRQKGEVDWNEPDTVKQLGLEFHRFGFGAPKTLSDDIFEKSLKVLAKSEKEKEPVLLHCGSANRVGAIWLAHRVLNNGVEVEAARKEAKNVGLRTAGYEKRALEYIKKKVKTQAKQK